jgi:hypothetical protein
MVLAAEGAYYIPASSVEVAMHLKWQEMGIPNSVVKQGVYAPFTMSGTLVINKVKASSYLAFQESDHLVLVGGWETPLWLMEHLNKLGMCR